MQPRGFPIAGSIIFAAGVVLGLAALGADTSSPRRNPNLPEFPASAGTHVTPAAPQSALDLRNATPIPAQTESAPPQMAPPTRSSFMASWQSVGGVVGYRLDISTDSSFNNYVHGYEDLDVGNVTGRVVTGLSPGTTYYYRVRAYNATGTSSSSDVVTASTTAGIGLIIQATFDSSITTRSNAATIEAMINRAIAIYESLFSDPITVKILFRYSSTAPDGSALPSGVLSESDFAVYKISSGSFIHALLGDAITGYDFTANTNLLGTTLKVSQVNYIVPSSANGRAVGLNTPPQMFPGGTVGSGAYDGIVTLNSTAPFQFSRPTGASNYDAQRATEHEMDEVLGFGSSKSMFGTGNSTYRPQDLFAWSSAGSPQLLPNGPRYFSVNGGVTKIVSFNQDPTGDFGDWQSTSCPQAHPYVQNAFACPGQYSDVTLTSPEAINLDVIGYNLINSPAPAPTDFNNDGKPDYVLYNASTRQTMIWYLNNNVLISTHYGPTLPAGYKLVGVAIFYGVRPDYLLFDPVSRMTEILDLGNSAEYGRTLPTGWQLVGTGDFNKDGNPDYILYNASTGQTVIWYLNGTDLIGAASGPTLPAGYKLVGLADFNRDGHPDYLLFNPSTRQTLIWYLNKNVLMSTASGPTIPSGYQLIGAADFNGDGHPDYLLYNPSTRQTVIWYMKNNVIVGAAAAPTPPAGWSVVAP